MIPNVFTIAAGTPFAQTLARGLIESLGAETNPLALADATILLPTRRAVRNLGDTFARLLGGAALLPQIRPLGDVDDEELLFESAADDLTLMPAIAPVRRRLLFAALVQRWDQARGDTNFNFAQAAALARELERFFDEAETRGVDLSKLESLAPEALALHWAQVRDFLVFLREEWPKLLASEGRMDPAARRNLQLATLAARYETSPPPGQVIAAGTTGSIPATAHLLSVIARMAMGSVILPGLDRELDEESWAALGPGHPQFGMKELIDGIGIARSEVRDWVETAPSPRNTLLRETLRPAPTTDAWRAIADRGGDTIAQGLDGLSLINAAHPGEEALAVALILRESLEEPGRTAALVTPDRNLARRVTAELGRWDIAIDDSAGKPLANTPPGTFLLLIAELVERDFAAVPLLALLKHPLTAGDGDPAEFRRMTRLLDRFCLRGPRPDSGLAGIKQTLSKAPVDIATELSLWLENIAEKLQPLTDIYASKSISIPEIAGCHAKVADALAATDEEAGERRLWKGDAGTAAAQLFASLQDEVVDLPPIEPGSYAPLIRTLMEERAIRPAYGRHPRLAILGPLEARLQHFDVLVLGSLNEGSWPAAAAADPWLSRPMREKLGLSSPERAIGLAAHDFATLAANPRVVLTRSLKADGAPTVASRWLQRLTQLTAGLNLRSRLDSATPYAALASVLETPSGYRPEPRPEPRPPVSVRPRGMSVTEIETWLRDPYAIYAKYVLGLKPLEPLDAEIGARERGTLIHGVLETFLKKWAGGDLSEERLVAIADEAFREGNIPHATLAVWRPRFLKAARWFAAMERERRDGIAHSYIETRGAHRIAGPAGDFELRARADRIDALRAGGAAIIDYKTGTPPTAKQVSELLSPQLPLEGVILAEGGFTGIGKLETSQLLYVQFGGGAEAGKLVDIPNAGELVREASDNLAARIAAFDREETPYLPRLIPYRTDLAGDYDHLSRVREWSVPGAEESEE